MNLRNDGGRFNWDDIEVGDVHLNHSDNFFAKKHINHEKLDEMDLIERLESADIEQETSNPFDRSEFNFDNKENSPQQEQVSDNSTLKSNTKSPPSEVETNVLTEVMLSKNSPAALELDVTADSKKPPPNIACMWSTQKPITSRTNGATKGAIAKIFKPPRAYEFKEFYERKKQEAQKRREEEERRMRQFHGRPAPNFNHYHKQIDCKPIVHVVTCPVTPNVLKKSREAEEKRKQKLEELMRQNQPPKVQARKPIVLKEEPFAPKKTQTIIEVRPFNLRAERRLQERKQFDIAAHQALEEKQKQVQNIRK